VDEGQNRRCFGRLFKPSLRCFAHWERLKKFPEAFDDLRLFDVTRDGYDHI
jgi:hypothetical protein